MAKSSQDKKETASPAKPAAKSSSAKKPAEAKKHAPPTGAPLIDTSLAASNAARQLVAGIGAKGASAGGSGKPESSLFKQMKSGLNKPHSATMDNLLNKTHGPGAGKGGGHGFDKQVGRNQTIGSDAARKSVPRRTAG